MCVENGHGSDRLFVIRKLDVAACRRATHDPLEVASLTVVSTPAAFFGDHGGSACPDDKPRASGDPDLSIPGADELQDTVGDESQRDDAQEDPSFVLVLDGAERAAEPPSIFGTELDGGDNEK